MGIGTRIAAGTTAKMAGKLAGGKGMLDSYGKSAAAYTPDKFERQYRKSILDKQKKLATQQGGLTFGEEQRAIASGVGQIQAAGQQQQATLARQSSARQTGMSGVTAQQQRDLSKMVMQGRGQVASQVRDVSLADLRKQQAQLQQNMLQASAMERARRIQALGAVSGDATAAAGSKGIQEQPDSKRAQDLITAIGKK